MASIFDSHAHYDDPAFDPDREALLAALHADSVCGIVNASASMTSSHASVQLAQAHPYVWAAVGVHPEEARNMTDADYDELRRLYAQPRVVAVGEIGLDYHYEDACPREKQLEVFERQLLLAQELGAPVIVHDREAHEDVLRLLQKHPVRGVVHCFSGSVEMLREVVKLGMYIGLGGTVTFKNARRPVEAAVAVPADRLLLETDAPYMAPTPYRGKRCDSGMIAYTAARIAELRGVPVEAVLEQTRQNACTLFGIHCPALWVNLA